MAQITYTNKVALNENQEIADINKVNASDMNEIKSVVNGLLSDVSTTDATLGYNAPFLNGITIEESGTGYIRFGDGTQICYFSQSVSTQVSTAFGNVKRSGPMTLSNYAKPFISTPIVNISISGSQGAWTMPASTVGSATNPGTHYLLRGDTLTTTTTFIINVVAIGKWK